MSRVNMFSHHESWSDNIEFVAIMNVGDLTGAPVNGKPLWRLRAAYLNYYW